MLKLIKVSRNPLAAHAHRQLAPENPQSMDFERLELTPASAVDPMGRAPHEHPSKVSSRWKCQSIIVLPEKPQNRVTIDSIPIITVVFVDPSEAKRAEFGAQGLSRHGGHKAYSVLLTSMC